MRHPIPCINCFSNSSQSLNCEINFSIYQSHRFVFLYKQADKEFCVLMLIYVDINNAADTKCTIVQFLCNEYPQYKLCHWFSSLTTILKENPTICSFVNKNIIVNSVKWIAIFRWHVKWRYFDAGSGQRNVLKSLQNYKYRLTQRNQTR